MWTLAWGLAFDPFYISWKRIQCSFLAVLSEASMFDPIWRVDGSDFDGVQTSALALWLDTFS